MISEVDMEDMKPEIEVVCIKENEDGSADCVINLNTAAMKYLLNFAFVSTLKTAIAEGKLLTLKDGDAPT